MSNDKERLEKAKKILNHTKGYGVYDGNDDIEIFEWLIEQAERVRELEQELHFCQVTKLSMDSVEKYTEDLKKQNMRYREAIERALGESGWGDEGNALYRTIGILTKALEEGIDE